jgi:hypothetical protein
LTATPSTVDELVGAWIGFDGSGGEFVRIELRADQSVYLAMVAAPNLITHDYGVQISKVIGGVWTVGALRATYHRFHRMPNRRKRLVNSSSKALRINLHGDKRQWKIESTLHMESRVEQSNTETKDAIAAAQRK